MVEAICWPSKLQAQSRDYLISLGTRKHRLPHRNKPLRAGTCEHSEDSWCIARFLMNPENPPPYPGPGPTAPYPPYPQQPMGPMGAPPPQGYPYPPPQGYPYQGYPQYGWQGGPQEPPKTTVYVVEDQRRDDLGPSTCLTACWTALCCCCLWDMLT
uniref:cysteine-rich and transmembrane domain-containing protein 1 n=1 Tax=Arvicanthis niloticus TaxID=61156 RepID=UPI00402B589A